MPAAIPGPAGIAPQGGTQAPQLALRAWALVNSASIEAVGGRETSCRAYATEARRLAIRANSAVPEVWAAHVFGLLELGLGRVAAAGDHLTRCARLAQACGFGDPYVVRYEPDLTEALLALGHRRDAVSVAGLLQDRAQRFRSGWGLAAAARCRGLLADEAQFEEEFELALALHTGVSSQFDCARTELCFGERLRRARRRADAREHLTLALAGFTGLGAKPWAERASRELQATTMTARVRRDPSAADDLTPQEQRVVLIMARGATIREAAAQLFLSPKTVEAHLGRAYRKLGVRNRAQLATRLAQQHRTIPPLLHPATRAA